MRRFFEQVRGMQRRLAASDRAAGWLLASGLGLCVLLFQPGGFMGVAGYRTPKTLVLEAFGLGAAALALAARRSLAVSVPDMALLGFVLLGAVSASAATNPWAALEGVAVSAGGLAVFASARALSGAGWREALLAAAALGTLAAAATVLAEAYALAPGLSMVPPGGTLGNRNYAAQLLALGMPLLLHRIVEARRPAPTAAWLLALGLTAAALVLTRGRGAWLGAAAGLLVFLVAHAVLSRGAAERRVRGRTAAALGALLAGATLAVALPNALEWKSQAPYLETLRGLGSYDQGSGRGRFIQYRNSLRMAADAPWLGVGPANWRIHYPRYASADDPSYVADSIWSTPVLPTGDVVGFLAERGLPATLLWLGALGMLALAALRPAQGGGPPPRAQPLDRATLLGVLVALGFVSSLDCTLQQAAPTFLFYLAAGALSASVLGGRTLRPSDGARRAGTAAGLLLALALSAPTLRQIESVRLVARAESMDDWERAAQRALGADALHTHLALLWGPRGECERALGHARSALALNPNAAIAQYVVERCER